ncbi:MAG: type II toxin-antitoxin system RelE/ParE family toxin [Planctomycetes bacterium]|nr:type II toxin-antitoxin system RelE/ParE family toxin [Planctomycetota bacterium]
MNYRVLLTSTAENDIEEAAIWWAENRSLEQAVRWLSKVREWIATLARHPERCPTAHETSLAAFHVRVLLFGIGRRPTHRILFRITDDLVEVLTVRHIARADVEPNEMI